MRDVEPCCETTHGAEDKFGISVASPVRFTRDRSDGAVACAAAPQLDGAFQQLSGPTTMLVTLCGCARTHSMPSVMLEYQRPIFLYRQGRAFTCIGYSIAYCLLKHLHVGKPVRKHSFNC